MPDARDKHLTQLRQAHESGILDDDTYNATLDGLGVSLPSANSGSGATATTGGVAAGKSGAAIGGNVSGDVTVIGKQIVQQTPSLKALSLPEALRHYLDHLIAAHQHLRLQGIRAGSQPLSVNLEKVYVSLRAIEKHRAPNTDPLKRPTSGAVPYEIRDTGIGVLTIPLALQLNRRLVIIGDPGSGKTTLLAYLALTYARALRDGVQTVNERFNLAEGDYLPILLPLRHLGQHLKTSHPDSSKDGAQVLLDYLMTYYANQSIPLPTEFFTNQLEAGRSLILLDGMDEVADPKLRARVARLIEAFVMRYPYGRYVVTSRKVGYEGVARIGENFGLAEVHEFSPAEVRQFIRDWTRVVETTLAESNAEAVVRLADEQADALITTIESNQRVAELAVNPLLLTVVALVHRYRAKLPERRSELYEEAVEVLLGHWDEAKGLETDVDFGGVKLDAGDRRSLLEPVAFWMHERQSREIELGDLRGQLLPVFKNFTATRVAAAKAVDAFLRVVNERSGLLVERGAGVYGFAHLTFQEYLAARALVAREDAVQYTLTKLADPWWREAILLATGYLSTQGKSRVSPLIGAVMNADPTNEPEPHHHLMLAAECLFDVGPARVEGDLLGEMKRRLQKEADTPFTKGDHARMLRKISAMSTLSRIESKQSGVISRFWKLPWGEPEWVTVPNGEFWMGSEYDTEKPKHRVYLNEFQIACVPITNTQYEFFVKDTKARAPEHWRGGKPPSGRENHPVVYINWWDAQAYCKWLTGKTGRQVHLPTEAEWEKAARGDNIGRTYPWGNEWQYLYSNTNELGLCGTSPVGLFLNGASPYNLLDMAGNVWEWCQTLYASYPYREDDGRERVDRRDAHRVGRGGSFDDVSKYVRCSCRIRFFPDGKYDGLGFRVVALPHQI